YNTGDDRLYKDDFKQSVKDYLHTAEQVDEDGNRMVSNPESNGRYHSFWLSIMAPRLRLARNLLREDGNIFISIDDTEIANLKNIADEIFGATNFIGNIAWESKTKSQNTKTAYN